MGGRVGTTTSEVQLNARASEVQCKHDEREEVEESTSEDQEHVASKERERQEHEEHEHQQHLLQVAFTRVFTVSPIARAGLCSVGSEDVVPCEVEREEGREQTQTHHEPTALGAWPHSPGAHAEPILAEVLVRLWLSPPCSWPVRNVLCLFFLLLPRILVVFLGENGNEGVLGDATLAHGTDQSLSGLLDPLVDALPAVEVAALGHHWVSR